VAGGVSHAAGINVGIRLKVDFISVFNRGIAWSLVSFSLSILLT